MLPFDAKLVWRPGSTRAPESEADRFGNTDGLHRLDGKSRLEAVCRQLEPPVYQRKAAAPVVLYEPVLQSAGNPSEPAELSMAGSGNQLWDQGRCVAVGAPSVDLG